jgi:hypothetical protein
MSQYRKKPVVIDAEQWDGSESSYVRILNLRGKSDFEISRDWKSVIISTLEGTMYADIGDWIIRGVKGELYPCKPDIFEATYEPALSGGGETA